MPAIFIPAPWRSCGVWIFNTLCSEECQTGCAFLMSLPLPSRNEWETSFWLQVLSLTHTEIPLPQSWAEPGMCIFLSVCKCTELTLCMETGIIGYMWLLCAWGAGTWRVAHGATLMTHSKSSMFNTAGYCTDVASHPLPYAGKSRQRPHK